MHRAWFTEEEVRVATERRLKYQGTAKVRLDQIQFDPPLPRDLNSKKYPMLHFHNSKLHGLHGRHRVQVVSELLPPVDRWWMVDLYLDGILPWMSVRNSGSPFLRSMQTRENPPMEKYTRRSVNMKKNRMNHFSSNGLRACCAGFNALLAIPGLWGRRMRISMIHCLVTIDCVEEILNYLESVKEFWSSLVNHHLIAMKRIDQDMVEKLQLMAPCASYIDVQAVYGFILSNMFVTSSEIEKDCLVQTSESTFQQTHMAGMECLDIVYQQVWLYAMQHYPSMPADLKNDNDLLAKPNHAKANECVVYKMAALVHCLRFCSTKITELMNQSPDRQIAQATLLKAQKPSCF
ncbi:hypothetical protein CIHG_10512 [Coccidioides immitis H538.4]|uniref:Uncharacterized protein n=1 Tax=Coccidioides immitis H538.4 TaxID=396776 RepID=A0A0J8S749_COCIT|nr:hypothetical protein CIHG_10512 [Coccidioides immitis H538.4]